MGKQWRADIVISDKMVESLLMSQFPELNCTEVQLLDTGWDNSVFLVNRRYIFRFPRRHVAVELIDIENRVLPWLCTKLPVSIPNPVFVGVPVPDYPFPFSGYQQIEGSPAHRLTLNDRQRANSSSSFAELLRSLHRIATDVAGRQGVPSSDKIGRMDLVKRIPLFKAYVEDAHNKGLIDDSGSLLSIINQLSTAAGNSIEHTTLVHGDLNFRNFLVDVHGSLTGVIDWGDVHIGHPAVDLALVYSYLPPEARSEFFAIYGNVDTETLCLAKFRSLYTNLVILLSAHDMGDSRQICEAQRSISNTLRDV